MSENENQKLANIEKLVEVIASSVSTLVVDMAGVKTDVSGLKSDVSDLKLDVSSLKSDVSGLKSDMAEVKSALSSFRVETRENFEKVNGRLDDLEESVNSIVKEYHPRIIALEEHVFGASSMAEASTVCPNLGPQNIRPRFLQGLET